MRRLKIISLTLLLAAALLFFVQSNCPTQGCALTPGMRLFVRLKNRTAVPHEIDFDKRITLAALVQSGDDRARWSSLRAAAVEGYVVAIKEGSIETANCFSLTRRDTHIEVALSMNAPPRERAVLEITPWMRERAERQGLDWSEPTLRREMVGRWCYFEGWLLFDHQHADESENTAPGNAGNWRATAWEIHPVTYIKVLR